MARRMSSHVPAIEGFCVCSDIVSTQESRPQELRRTSRGEREKFDRKLRSSKNPRGNHLNCRKRELFDGERKMGRRRELERHYATIPQLATTTMGVTLM